MNMNKAPMQKSENIPSGHALIFAGPHGAGKDTLEAQFTRSQPNASRIVRHITREPSSTEIDGHDYHFVSEEHFLDLAAKNAFVEHARYIGMMSGTSYAELDAKLEQSRYASMSANFRDGLSLHRKLGERGLSSTCFFISPVSEVELYDNPDVYLESVRARMVRRGRSSDLIEGRLVQAASYRELYIENREEAVYVDNSDGRLEEASRLIAQTALSLTISAD